jgi:hypothetical protein
MKFQGKKEMESEKVLRRLFAAAVSLSVNAAFAAIAGRLGLLKSAGSDFHGANKANTLGMTVEDAFIGPLLERL